MRSMIGLVVALGALAPSAGFRSDDRSADARPDDASGRLRANAPPAESGSKSPLDGWVVVNGLPSTWRADGDEIVCTGVPNGMLRSAKSYGDFTLELEWNHAKPDGNAGIFVWADPIPARGGAFPRSIEAQVMLTDDVKDDQGRLLYTGHGDLFSIHGARCEPVRPHPAGWQRCLPSARRTKGAGEWNHYRVEGRDGTLTLAVNGEVVSEVRNCEPRRGYLCLESEGSEVRFRNIRITEPSTGASDGSASQDTSGPWLTMLDPLLLRWRADDANVDGVSWTTDGTLLRFDGKGGNLWMRGSVADFDLVVDWRWTKEHQGLMPRPVILPDGTEAKNEDGSPKTVEVEERDGGIFVRGSTKAQVNMWAWTVGSGEIYGYRTDPRSSSEVRAACTPKSAADRPVGEWNRFEISMRGKRLSVTLNGVLVIDAVELAGVPKRGPVGLQSHGCPMEFMNIYLRPVGGGESGIPDWSPGSESR